MHGEKNRLSHSWLAVNFIEKKKQLLKALNQISLIWSLTVSVVKDWCVRLLGYCFKGKLNIRLIEHCWGRVDTDVPSVPVDLSAWIIVYFTFNILRKENLKLSLKTIYHYLLLYIWIFLVAASIKLVCSFMVLRHVSNSLVFKSRVVLQVLTLSVCL